MITRKNKKRHQVLQDVHTEVDHHFEWRESNKTQTMEHIVHGIFLLLGLITVGCVLLITVYLVISGIPAIREIGL